MANRGVGPKFAEGTASAPSGESKQAKQSDLARNFAARELIRSEVRSAWSIRDALVMRALHIGFDYCISYVLL